MNNISMTNYLSSNNNLLNCAQHNTSIFYDNIFTCKLFTSTQHSKYTVPTLLGCILKNFLNEKQIRSGRLGDGS